MTMNPTKSTAVLLLLLTLSACASLRPERTDEIQPVEPTSGNNAVIALLDTAKQDTAAGRLDAASANLERALRIEPRNAGLWHQLALIRLQQGQGAIAAGLATKSNSFAGSNSRLRAENWRVIGQARAQQGDHNGATHAFTKAQELDGSQ